MNPPSTLLRTLLLICVAFFTCMGLAHFFGLKWPVLFVYWDTPYYSYQDKIIAFTLITYISLFLGAARRRVIVPYALVSIWGTVIGLSLVNSSGALEQVLNGRGNGIYWTIIAAFAGLACVLTGLWVKERSMGEKD